MRSRSTSSSSTTCWYVVVCRAIAYVRRAACRHSVFLMATAAITQHGLASDAIQASSSDARMRAWPVCL